MGDTHSWFVRALVLGATLSLLLGSQVYWIRRLRPWFRKLIPNQRARCWLGLTLVAVLLLMFASSFGWLGRSPTPVHLNLKSALLTAPFSWWVFSSVVAFLIAIIFWSIDGLARGTAWSLRQLLGRPPERDASAALASPGRRRFLGRTATVATALPFVSGAYGLVYGRLKLETTRQRIRLARLPKTFDGLRMAQLSDIHIGPFMPEDEIRKIVEVANALQPDLIALTGDFVTWDASTQRAVVGALAGLKAPLGVFGCLGNHEAWSKTEASITRLFGEAGIRILRQARAEIAVQGERLTLIGVDFQTRGRVRMTPSGAHFVRQYLEGVETLIAPDTVNILMSHNPNTFDRAAELGIDLSLAGHTHGGQVTLEFVSPALSPSRLITPYVRGWFGKGDAQLYVNRGIGTIGVPIRIDAPPEITLFELTREA